MALHISALLALCRGVGHRGGHTPLPLRAAATIHPSANTTVRGVAGVVDDGGEDDDDGGDDAANTVAKGALDDCDNSCDDGDGGATDVSDAVDAVVARLETAGVEMAGLVAVAGEVVGVFGDDDADDDDDDDEWEEVGGVDEGGKDGSVTDDGSQGDLITDDDMHAIHATVLCTPDATHYGATRHATPSMKGGSDSTLLRPIGTHDNTLHSMPEPGISTLAPPDDALGVRGAKKYATPEEAPIADGFFVFGRGRRVEAGSASDVACGEGLAGARYNTHRHTHTHTMSPGTDRGCSGPSTLRTGISAVVTRSRNLEITL